MALYKIKPSDSGNHRNIITNGKTKKLIVFSKSGLYFIVTFAIGLIIGAFL